MTKLRAIITSLSLVYIACAGKEDVPVALLPSTHQEARSDLNPRSQLMTDEIHGAKIEVGQMQANGLAGFEKIRINLKHATVRISAKISGSKKSDSTLLIKKTKGDKNCQPKVAISGTRLTIIEATQSEITAMNAAVSEISRQSISNSAGLSATAGNFSDMIQNPITPFVLSENQKQGACAYDLTLVLNKPALLDIDVAKGSIQLENWSDSVHIAMNWGEVEFTEVGTLSLECDECTVSGSGITNSFKYKLGKGNVGVEGLNATVEGVTSGDTVLMWKKITPGSKISLISKVGDIIVRVPERTLLWLDLKVPRGEVYSRLKSYEIVVNAQELRHGIPLTIVAESGNIKIVH